MRTAPEMMMSRVYGAGTTSTSGTKVGGLIWCSEENKFMASVVTYILIKILTKLICKGICELCWHVRKIL